MGKQFELIENVIRCAGRADLQFVRDFLNYVYRYGVSFSLDQVSKLKIATENGLKNDYVLNHQYAAYLIREKVQLDDARYYLDLALIESPNNTSIIHSLGNLCFSLYKHKLEIGEKEDALRYYEAAKDCFAKSRTLMNSPDEHSYYTEIDMTLNRLNNMSDIRSTRAMLDAENKALTFEALRVVPYERQNLLKKLVGGGVDFGDISEDDKVVIIDKVLKGGASPLLLDYYLRHLLVKPKVKSWNRLKDVVMRYWNEKPDASTSTVIGLISKRAFILNASNRFEYLRTFYDQLVRYRDTKVSFPLLAEYVRLLCIDAFVLKKYEFLKSTSAEVSDIFRDCKPRFLEDEYILENSFYDFDESDNASLKGLFINHSSDFFSQGLAKRFSGIVSLNPIGFERYISIQIDPITGYFIRGVRKEVGMQTGKTTLHFVVKYMYEGFSGTGFRI